MLMNPGVRNPAEKLPDGHRDASPPILQPDIFAPQLSERFICEDAKFQSAEGFFSSLLFLSAGASHARLPTSPQAQQVLLVLPCQHHRGATAVGSPQECVLHDHRPSYCPEQGAREEKDWSHLGEAAFVT